MILHRHKNNIDVAVEIVKFFQPPGKDYAMIKVRWWNIGLRSSFDTRIESWLTLPDTERRTRNRRKYPVKTWREDWIPYETDKPYLAQIGK